MRQAARQEHEVARHELYGGPSPTCRPARTGRYGVERGAGALRQVEPHGALAPRSPAR